MATHVFFHRNLALLALERLALAACAALALGSAMAQTPAAQTRAGQVMSVTGRVVATDSFGQERFLEKGADVRPGDKIVTGDAALIQMRMVDGGYLSVRAGTELAIERFVFDAKESSNSGMLLSLVKGGFRSITGLIGRTNPGSYAIRASTATVGIRGTDHEPMVILPGHASGAAPGLYDKVNDGETFIRTDLGLLALTRGQVGFAPVVPDRAPQVLPAVPEFYKIEIKTDARDPKDAAPTALTTSRTTEGDKADKGDKGDKGDKAEAGVMLRPSLAARREALKDASADTLNDGNKVGAERVDLSGALVNRTAITTDLKVDAVKTLDAANTTLSTDKAISTTTLTTTSTTTLKDAAVVTSPTTSTLLTAPLTTTVLKDAVVAPITTTIVPTTTTTLKTTSLVAPVTTTAPKTTLLVAPTTTTSTTTAISPTTATATTTAPKTLTAPTTTLKSQILTR